jgi:prepilin peptidase CpaA
MWGAGQASPGKVLQIKWYHQPKSKKDVKGMLFSSITNTRTAYSFIYNIMSIDKFCLLLIITILAIASLTDLFYKRIPNWLTLSSLICGIFFQLFFRGFAGFFISLQGIVIGFALTFIIYLVGGLGAGDVKLMSALGAFLGPKEIFLVFIFSSLLSGVYALILLASHGFILNTIKRYFKMFKTLIFTLQLVYIPPLSAEKRLGLRFGIMIALGTLLTKFYLNNLSFNKLLG